MHKNVDELNSAKNATTVRWIVTQIWQRYQGEQYIDPNINKYINTLTTNNHNFLDLEGWDIAEYSIHLQRISKLE